MLTRSIARKADLIVCMTDEQYETLNRMIPDERLYVLAGGVDDPTDAISKSTVSAQRR